MISISKNYLRMNIIFQIALMNCFHSSNSSHWHKNRRFNFTMISENFSSSRFGIRISMLEFEFQDAKIDSRNEIRRKEPKAKNQESRVEEQRLKIIAIITVF